MNLSFTRHARTRMQQRGLSKRDVRLIVQHGFFIRRGLCVLRRGVIDIVARRSNSHIQTLERLRNCAVVIEGNHVITCYHLHGEAGRSALRRNSRRWRRAVRRH